MPQIAKVAVAAATYAIDKPYDYTVPLGEEIAVGMRVLVPFGRGNRISEAVVLSLHEAVPEHPLKAISAVLDDEPLLDAKGIKLALWMRQRYFCTLYDAIRIILPAAVWYQHTEMWCLVPQAPTDELTDRERLACQLLEDGAKSSDELLKTFADLSVYRQLRKKGVVSSLTQSNRKVSDKTVMLVSLNMNGDMALAAMAKKKKSAPKQYDAVTFLAQYGQTSVHDLSYFIGVSRKALNSLEKQGIIKFAEHEEYRINEYETTVKAKDITLNEEQQTVFDDILAQTQTVKAGVTLLEGVTGSGKTLIYIRLAQALLQQGKSVMILVPEIALTPQMMAKFSAYFGDEVALLHSGLRMTERYDQYKRIRRGEAHIVLGTRSAVFAPLQNIGLIVLDEEQESSYQSENAPSYHARDIAKYRCVQENARLLLGSATPTVESAYFARKGDYQHALLRKRYNAHHLPKVMLADMRKELHSGNVSIISRTLQQELRKNIDSGEQSILFLNRRGNSKQLLCPSCGYVPQCPRCSVYLTYHSANDRLMCHYCGYSEKTLEKCPECGDSLKKIGVGTQKVEQELKELFPEVGILRMDADTVGEGHEKLLREFSEKKIPILLGTQMVAKGLDFENVTLVGVLAADLSLYVDHFRAAERTFSLLTQVVGRAGRGEKEGRAVIQTYTPENDVIQAAAQQDYERFYAAEIRLRKIRLDPPFADQFIITITGDEENRVRHACQALCNGLRTATKQEAYKSLEIVGPAPCPVVKVNNRYRYRITVIGKNDVVVRNLIASFMKEFSGRKENRNMNIYTDCNLMD